MVVRALWILIFAMLIVAAGPGCDDNGGDGDGDADGDGDVDADGDVDGDVDGDGDSDADADADIEVEPCLEGTGGLDLIANINTIGAVLNGSDLPESATIRYRDADSATWHSGHPLVLTDAAQLATSLFGLEGGTSYAVQVQGEGIDTCATIATQPEELTFSPTSTIHVDASAAAGGDGSEGAPFRTVSAGAAAATAGGRVLVADGVYHEQVNVGVSGAEGAFIQIVAAGDNAVLDGSESLDGASWSPHGSVGNVWSTGIGAGCHYLARDGRRIYHVVEERPKIGAAAAMLGGGITRALALDRQEAAPAAPNQVRANDL